jgi:hypothetical protein
MILSGSAGSAMSLSFSPANVSTASAIEEFYHGGIHPASKNYPAIV